MDIKKLLETFDDISESKKVLKEAEQITIAPAQQKTSVIRQGDKTLGTVTNPQLAAQIKQSLGKGELSLAGDELGEAEGDEENGDSLASAVIEKIDQIIEGTGLEESSGDLPISDMSDEDLADYLGVPVEQVKQDREAAEEAARDRTENTKESAVEESGLQAYLGKKKYGEKGMKALQKAGREGASKEKMAQIRAKHDKLDEKAVSKKQQKFMGMVHAAQKGEKPASKEVADVAKSMKKGDVKDFAKTKHKGLPEKKKKTNEADIPKSGADFGAGLGAGRSQKVIESMNNKHTAAYHEGMSHGLREQPSRVKHYADMEEAKQYYEGYKQGLDEAYGMGEDAQMVEEVFETDVTEGSRKLMDPKSFYSKVDALALKLGYKKSRDVEGGFRYRIFKGDPDNDAYITLDYDPTDDYYPVNWSVGMYDYFGGNGTEELLGSGNDSLKDGLKEVTGLLKQYSVKDESTPDEEDDEDWSSYTDPPDDDEVYEMDKTAYMKAQAKKTPGDTFKAFGQTFKDKDVLEADAFAFESLDRQLNALLNEGLSVNMSQGLGGGLGQDKDTVSVTATGDDASKLIDFIKQVGLGGLGGSEKESGDDAGAVVAVSDYGAPKFSASDDMKSMLSVVDKISGNDDYEVEKDEHDHEHDHGPSPCMECGMNEAECECGTGGDKNKDKLIGEEEEQINEVSQELGYRSLKVAKEKYKQARKLYGENHPTTQKYLSLLNDLTDKVERRDSAQDFRDKSDDAADKLKMQRMKASKVPGNDGKGLRHVEPELSPKEKEAARRGYKQGREYDMDSDGYYAHGDGYYDQDPKYQPGWTNRKDKKQSFKNWLGIGPFATLDRNELRRQNPASGEGSRHGGLFGGPAAYSGDDWEEYKLAQGDKEEIDESLNEWANNAGGKGTDASFEEDIEFMTKVISGGLNKPKRDQTTLPHTAVKVVEDDPINEWKKLGGII